MKNLLKLSLILLIIAGVIFICEGTNQIRIIRSPGVARIFTNRSLQYTTEEGLYDISRSISSLNYAIDDFAYMLVGTTFIATGLSLMVKLKQLEGE